MKWAADPFHPAAEKDRAGRIDIHAKIRCETLTLHGSLAPEIRGFRQFETNLLPTDRKESIATTTVLVAFSTKNGEADGQCPGPIVEAFPLILRNS